MLASLLGWSLVVGLGALVVHAMLSRWEVVHPDGSREIEESAGHEIVRGAKHAVLVAMACGSLAFWGPVGTLLSGGGAPAGDVPPGGVYDPPAAPTGDVAVLAGDSTVTLSTSAFDGDGNDTHESSDWYIRGPIDGVNDADTVWADFASDSLVHWTPAGITTGVGLTPDETYRAFFVHTGAEGGASDPDSVEFVATADTPFLQDDFSTYTTTGDFLSDPRGIYNDGEAFCANGCANSESDGEIHLDAGVAYAGLGQSIRYDHDGGGTLSVQAALSPNKTKVWVEWAVMFESGFTMAGGGASAEAYKFLFANIQQNAPATGRWGIEFSNGDNGNLFAVGPDDLGGQVLIEADENMESLNDGQWHVYRWYINADDDEMEFWIDGVSQGGGLSSGWSTAGGTMTAVSFGRNMNKQVAPESMWWGYWKIYDQDPGW